MNPTLSQKRSGMLACTGHHILHTLLPALLAHTALNEIRHLVSVFVDVHLLHWFECLSTLRELESGIMSLDTANEAISVCTKSDSDSEY